MWRTRLGSPYLPLSQLNLEAEAGCRCGQYACGLIRPICGQQLNDLWSNFEDLVDAMLVVLLACVLFSRVNLAGSGFTIIDVGSGRY